MRIMAHAFRVLVAFAMCCGVAQASDLHALMAKCIPEVHPTTIGAIVRAESTGYMYILADDGPGHLPWSNASQCCVASTHPPLRRLRSLRVG